MFAPDIVVTSQDLERLQQLIAAYDAPAAEELDAELARAQVVPHHQVSKDVVTMNSEVTYEDLSTRVQRTIRIVYPQDADSSRSWVSVLAPIGSALLGLRVGQEIEWRVPGGKRRVRVVAVPYQPEANGDSGR